MDNQTHTYPDTGRSTHLTWSERRRFKLQNRKKRGKQFCQVYGLIDGNGNVRYIGQTKSDIATRLKYHFAEAEKANNALAKWIRGTAGVDIILIDGNATWDVSEILIIDRYRREGHDLLNVTRGGRDTAFAARREGLI